MSQREVIEWLEKKYRKGSTKYYTAREISEGIGRNVSQNCTKVRRRIDIETMDVQTKQVGGRHYYCIGYRYKP
jgi:hypothetical protein